MPCNNKMGNGVSGFLAYMGWYGGMGGDERFGGGREKAFGAFFSGST